MDNVQNCDSYINITSSQIYGSYLSNSHFSVTCTQTPRPSVTSFACSDCSPAISSIYQNSWGKICKDQGNFIWNWNSTTPPKQSTLRYFNLTHTPTSMQCRTWSGKTTVMSRTDHGLLPAAIKQNINEGTTSCSEGISWYVHLSSCSLLRHLFVYFCKCQWLS
jgi:hypothetical protein